MATRFPTMTWYTEYGVYKGWSYVKDVSYGEVTSWLNSSNYIFIGENEILSGTTSKTKLLNYFGRK